MTVEHDILHNMAKVSRTDASELVERAHSRPPSPSPAVAVVIDPANGYLCSLSFSQAITELEVAVSILRPELRSRDEVLLGMGKHDRKRAARDLKKQKELDNQHAGLGKNARRQRSRGPVSSDCISVAPALVPRVSRRTRRPSSPDPSSPCFLPPVSPNRTHTPPSTSALSPFDHYPLSSSVALATDVSA